MKLSFIILFLLSSISLHASKVKCNSLYTFGKENLSNSPFIPLSVFIDSEKNKYAVRTWALKRNMKSIGPGIGIMYRTASLAAEKVLASLKISPKTMFTFDKPTGNFVEDFTKTVKVMRSRKYKYLKNAVILSPEGVYTILPLAVYDPVADTYVPVVIKGHQDLKKSDITAAALTAYAIGPYMSTTAETAKVSLRPMVPKRKSTNINEAEHKIFVENEKARIKEVYENFIKEFKDFSETLETKYVDYFAEFPEASQEQFVKDVIEPLLTPQKHEISQIPYSAKKSQREILKLNGIHDKHDLAQIDINSDRFINISLRTGISPYRLKYLIQRSRAFLKDEILIIESYQDPGKDLDYVVHFDIEGAFEPDIKSGSYYLGAEIQSQKTVGAPVKDYTPKGKNQDKFFFGGFREFTQENVDKAWVDFLMFLKTEKRLQNGNYRIAVYSSYEDVKINQLVDIRRDKPEKFTDAEKASVLEINGVEYPLYKEITVYSPKPGLLEKTPQYKTQGFLIRRTDFFQKHPEITPEDVFNYKEKLYDMLPFYRHQVAGPTKSNGLKSLLPYSQKELPKDVVRYEYGEGDNGLNCIAWYYHYLKTGDPQYLERIRVYLELDIDGNRMLWDFIRRHANEANDINNEWNETTKAALNELMPIFTKKKFHSNLLEKRKALHTVLGKRLIDLEDEELATLAEILDRSSYLGNRRNLLNNKRMSPARIKAILSHRKHGFETKRKKLLLEFIKVQNPEFDIDNMTADIQDALYYLTSLSSNMTSQHMVNRIIAYEQMLPQVKAFIAENAIASLGSHLDPAALKLALENPLWVEKIKSLKKVQYRLLKFNEIPNPVNNSSIVKDYGFGAEFIEYESLNMKKIWESIFIDYLLKDIK